MPSSAHRSLVPMRSTSTPGTAAISLALPIARGVSSITITRVAALSDLVSSPIFTARKANWGTPPAPERWPSGGYLSLATTSRASSAESTCGMTMPSAPLSSARVAMEYSPFGTRTIGASPASSAPTAIWQAVSRVSEPCSRSMNSQSKPAVFIALATSTVRVNLMPTPSDNSPRSSRSRARLRTVSMNVPSAVPGGRRNSAPRRGLHSSAGGRGAVAGTERALHQHDVEPAAEFESGRLQRADHTEAQRAVEPDRGRVAAVADHGDHLAEAAALARFEQRLEQRAADALTLAAGLDVDRVLDGVAVGGARPVGGGIGIADDAPALLGDEVGIAAVDDGAAPTRHFGGVGRLDLEARRAMQHVVMIDRGDRRDIRLLARADRHGGNAGVGSRMRPVVHDSGARTLRI